MYPFVTHTWNAIKGICFHDCPYCYMKKFDGLLPVRIDPKELKVNLGNGNFIFVGSGTDAWAFDIPSDWITCFWIIVTCLITTIFSNPKTLHVF